MLADNVINPPALASITYVVLFFCDVHPLTLMIPALLLGKIYANSFLLALNGRMYISQGRVLPIGLSDSALYPGSPIGSAAFSTYEKCLLHLTILFVPDV